MYKRKKSGGKRENNGYCMRETGEGNKTNACSEKEGKGGGEGQRERDEKLDGALSLLSLAPVESCTERSPVY